MGGENFPPAKDIPRLNTRRFFFSVRFFLSLSRIHYYYYYFGRVPAVFFSQTAPGPRARRFVWWLVARELRGVLFFQIINTETPFSRPRARAPARRYAVVFRTVAFSRRPGRAAARGSGRFIPGTLGGCRAQS